MQNLLQREKQLCKLLQLCNAQTTTGLPSQQGKQVSELGTQVHELKIAKQ